MKKLVKLFNNSRQAIDNKFLKDFLNGKTILLLDSILLINYKLTFPEHKLFKTEDNYMSNYITFPVLKSHEFSENIYHALVLLNF